VDPSIHEDPLGFTRIQKRLKEKLELALGFLTKLKKYSLIIEMGNRC
jgi:hypothetical protein